MIHRTVLLSLLLAAGTLASEPVTVLELYTSQGCSSCPGADAAFQTLADRNTIPAGLIPLVYHVDYWNHLGWKDPYSQAKWSGRQRRYSGFLGERQIYTPQLIVNGRRHRVGPRDPAVLDRIAAKIHAEAPGELLIKAARRGSAVRARAKLKWKSPIPSNRSRLRLVLYQHAPATQVPAGENHGRRLVNAFVVRDMTEGASLSKGNSGDVTTSHQFHLNQSWGESAFGVVAMLEDQADGRILHAARVALD